MQAGLVNQKEFSVIQRILHRPKNLEQSKEFWLKPKEIC
jgi:hypothetical protein